MERIKVAWEGPQITNHSLAIVNRNICSKLAQDNDIFLQTVSNESLNNFKPKKLDSINVYIQHQWPPRLEAPDSGAWVLQQPWEYGSIPKLWKEKIFTEIDEVWVPSKYVKHCYINDGVPESKVKVIPNGVDTKIFNENVQKINLPTNKKFKFLFLGGVITRKGVDTLLSAYLRTFSKDDDVTLIIKDFGIDSQYKNSQLRSIVKEAAQRDDCPEILYFDEDMSDHMIASLYVSCDCLVHPYRSEGFGMPIAEAMACGLVVIIPDKGAARDFCDDKTGILIQSQFTHLTNRNRVDNLELVDLPYWLEVDEKHLMSQLRWVYENQENAKEIGVRAARKIANEFTWDKAYEKVKERVQELSTICPTRFESIDTKILELYERNEFTIGKNLLYRTMSENDENIGEKFYNLALFLIKEGSYEQAIWYLQKSLDVETDLQIIQDTYNLIGLSHYHLENYRASYEYFDKSLQLGKSAEADQYIKILLEKLDGKIDGSVDELNKILSKSVHGNEILVSHHDWSSYIKVDDKVLVITIDNKINHDQFITNDFQNILWFDVKSDDLNKSNKNSIHEQIYNYVNKLEELDGIILLNVIERLKTPKDVLEMIQLCNKKISKNGVLGIESINPACDRVTRSHLDCERLYQANFVSKLLEAVNIDVKVSDDSDINYYIVGQKNCIEVEYFAPIYDWSGYATEAISFLNSLKLEPMKLMLESTNRYLSNQSHGLINRYLNPLQKNSKKNCLVKIHHHIPEFIRLGGDTPFQIIRTMFETDRIPEHWVEICNQMQQVWVPTDFNLKTFSNSGVKEELIKVIPQTVDFTKYSRSQLYPDNINTYRFLSIFDFHYRKGWDVLIKAFAQEFMNSDNVELILKVNKKFTRNIKPEQEVYSLILNSGLNTRIMEKIKFITEDINEHDLISLYEHAHAFVLPTRGEGWGRPFMEAMAMELPTIATNWSGQLEFMNKENSYLIDIEGLEIIDSRMPSNNYFGHYWASPSIEDTRKKMREVYENRQLAKLKGQFARNDIYQKYNERKIAEKIYSTVENMLKEKGLR